MSTEGAYPSMTRVYEIMDAFGADGRTDEEQIADAKAMAMAELEPEVVARD